jgi:hypothetical protein
VHLAWVDQPADDVKVADLPVFAQDKVRRGIPATSHAEAGQIVENLRQQAAECRAAAAGAAGATPDASASPTPSGSLPPSPGATPPAGSGTGGALTPGAAGTLTPSPLATTQGTVPAAGAGTPASTVGPPVIAVNPQATQTAGPSASSTPVGAGCGGLAP